MPNALPPTGLLCELMAHPERTRITTPTPRFGWVVNDAAEHASQTAYQILVASSREKLFQSQGDLWDSGAANPGAAWSSNANSLHVLYAGAPLAPHATYYWKVRTWNQSGEESPYSEVQCFHTGELSSTYATAGYPLTVTEVPAIQIIQTNKDSVFIDFGQAAFGTLAFSLESPVETTVTVALGEVKGEGFCLNREPGGSRRYREVQVQVKVGTHAYQVDIPPDERNTGPQAICLPKEQFEVMPFRYAEVRGLPAPLSPDEVWMLAVHYPFDDNAAGFISSSPALNRVWEMCKHTMKATTVCGLYIDGDRERIPYEADAYINMLGHYATDREFTMARRTHEYLLVHPTWPTEWILFSVLIAWEDYLHTGDCASLAEYYSLLQAKTLSTLAREDGLISTTENVTEALLASIHLDGQQLRDIVDWPQGERDGYDMRPVNTVVNAFHYRAVTLMQRIALALGKHEDAAAYQTQAVRVREAIWSKLFDATHGVFLDGEGSTHASLHANMFALAFGLVPDACLPTVLRLIRSRGMACSVYGSQFLLDALYAAGEAEYAFSLLTTPALRGWLNMLEKGSTIAMEAWDDRFKPNQDWNHAWGAAPANLIPRRLMGIRPLLPGYEEMLIQPQPGPLRYAEIVTPTIRGAIHVAVRQEEDAFLLDVVLPANMRARVELPAGLAPHNRVIWNGDSVEARREAGRLVLDGVGSGAHTFVR